MKSSGKVWVIGEATPKRKTPQPAPAAGPLPSLRRAVQSRVGSMSLPVTQAPARETPSVAKPSVAKQPLRVLAAAYTLGNLAPYLTRHRARSGIWAGLGVAAVVCWTFTWGQWYSLQSWMAKGTFPFALWFCLLGAASIGGIVAGSRAVLRVGDDPAFEPQRLPSWLRHPKATGLFGFLVPGTGLLCSGHPRRAAVAYANAGLTALALLVLIQWKSLWRINQQAESGGIASQGLEHVFVASMVVAAIGGFAWIYSAFDSARLVSHWGDRMRTLGPWWVLPVCGICLLGFLNFDAAGRARDLDRVAQRMHAAGYVLIPYHVERAALHFDPSSVPILVRAADLAAELGHAGSATELRTRAEWHWTSASEALDLHIESAAVSQSTTLPANQPTVSLPETRTPHAGATILSPPPYRDALDTTESLVP